jgi:anti-anti-sigma factor
LKDPARGEVGVTIVDAFGALDARSMPAFHRYLAGMIEEGGQNLVINCEKVTQMAPAAVEPLGAVAKRCRDRGGDLRLFGVVEAVRRVITSGAIDPMLRFYDNERGAVMSFKYM